MWDGFMNLMEGRPAGRKHRRGESTHGTKKKSARKATSTSCRIL